MSGRGGGLGARRLVTIGRMDEYGEMVEYEFCLAGNLSAAVENKITFLKVAQLQTQAGERPLDYHTLLAVIAELNDEVAAKFKKNVAEVT